MKQNYTSAGTSGNFGTPALFNNKLAVKLMTGKTVLDVGCGRFKTAEKRCLDYALSYSGYDPYNLSEAENKEAMSYYYDVATLSNVLNVIDTEQSRLDLVKLALECADTVIISVYEGDKSGKGKQTKKDCYQMNCKITFYLDEIQKHFDNLVVYADSKIIVLRDMPF